MRASLRIFARDLRRLVTNPAALVIALGVCLLPSLYAWVNILANWDPYENTSGVPVAVTIEDAGADVSGMGRLNAGAMIREELEKNHQLDWTFVDEKDALDGVRSGRYYAAFVIPEDFTATLAGVLDGHPKQARIAYYVNEKANAVAPKVTDTGATTLEDQISSEFVSVTGTTVTERLRAAAGGAATNADAARTSAEDALRTAQDDLDTLAKELDDARGTIAAAQRAANSARDTLSTAGTAADDLSSSLNAALSGLANARTKAGELTSAASDALASASSTLAGLSSTASHDVSKIAADAGWAQGKLDAAISEMRAADGTISGLRSSLESTRDAAAALAPTTEAGRALQQRLLADLDEQISSLAQLSEAQAARLDDLQRTSDALAAGVDATRGLSGAVDDAVQTSDGALRLLRDDFARTVAPQLASAIDTLGDKGGRLAGGAAALGPMIEQADGTLAALEDLLAQADHALESGAGSLRSAAEHLGGLADDLAAVQSAESLPAVADVLALDPQATGSALGSPAALVDEAVFPVANYGSGVAPFYTNLALWVGGFVLVAVYKLEVDRSELGGIDPTPTQAFFGRWLLFALLGQVQALVCCVGDVALGVQCVSSVAFVAAGMVASGVYVLLVYALAAAFRHVGKALAVLLVVLQIPGASGLYPIQMQPAFFRALEPWLPFTYGIGAMREAVAGFYDGAYARDLLTLALFVVPALLVGIAVRQRLLGVNALFDRRLGETDLLVTEHDATGERQGRLALVLDALATSPAHRQEFLARAARFELAYPARVRRGLRALLAVPLALLALMLLRPGRFEVLVAWVVALVAASGYLIGLEYLRESLRERAGVARLDADQLMALARGGGGAGLNDSAPTVPSPAACEPGTSERPIEKNSEAAR